jgi:hypothetical protein
MKFLTMKGALALMGSKKAIATACTVSPAAVTKAFIDAGEGAGCKVRMRLDGDQTVTELVYPRSQWRVVTAQVQKPGSRTRNY